MRVVIIGHTVGVKRCIVALDQNPNHEIVAVFTHPRAEHQPDLDIFEKRAEHFGEFAFNVFEVEKQFNIPLKEYSDLGQDPDIEAIKDFTPDIVITVGCRDILKANFIESFQYVINLHPFNLPIFRGAGIDSWMILQGCSDTSQNATCHYINPRIDAGNIINTLQYDIGASDTPLDIFKKRINLLGELLIDALEKLSRGPYEGTSQEESISKYYPRLNTHRDGQLDFQNWDGAQLALFVRAFSYPYDGAWIKIGDRKIHFMRAKFVAGEENHPFAFGLVYRRSDEQLWIAVKGGSLVVSEIEENGAQISPKKIKIGKFLNA